MDPLLPENPVPSDHESGDGWKYMFSGAGTLGQLQGDVNLQQIQAARSAIAAQTASNDLARAKAEDQMETLDDPVLKEIDAQKKMAALEDLLPAGASGLPQSTIRAESNGRRLTVAPGQDPSFLSSMGGESPTHDIPMRAGALRSITSSPGFQVRQEQQFFDQINRAILQAEKESATGKGNDPHTGAEFPLTPEQQAASKERAAKYRAYLDSVERQARLTNPALLGKQLYPGITPAEGMGRD